MSALGLVGAVAVAAPAANAALGRSGETDLSCKRSSGFMRTPANLKNRNALHTSSRKALTASRRRASAKVRASSEDSAQSGGPLSPESPSGQLLRELIQSHPHLVPSAAERQLDLLAEETEQEKEGGQPEGETTGARKKGKDVVLSKRIEDVKRQERQRAIEEVIYSLVVQKFIESGCPLLLKVPFVHLDPSNPLTMGMLGLVPSAPTRKEDLEKVHSEEVLEMVHEHMERVLGGKSGGIPGGQAMEDKVLVGTSKMKLGQVYAASIMYGYFLRRVDQRFQLEKKMRMMLGGGTGGVLGGGSTGGAGGVRDPVAEQKLEEEKRMRMDEFLVGSSPWDGLRDQGQFGVAQNALGKQQSQLRAYVSSFDAPALQQSVTVRSREGLSVVERHTEALFGKPEVVGVEGGVTVLKDDQTHVTVSTLRRLVLEAVAFGNFLWDVESYVDSRYKITK